MWPRDLNGSEYWRTTIGKIVDDAMVEIERDNQSLKGFLPKDYARPGLDKQRLGQLINMVSDIGLGGPADRAKDILGRVYEDSSGSARSPAEHYPSVPRQSYNPIADAIDAATRLRPKGLSAWTDSLRCHSSRVAARIRP
jgi:hypothetical protein